MKKLVFSVVCSILIIASCSKFVRKDTAKLAESESITWLELIDTAKYDIGYDKAADLFKKAVSKEKWIESMNIYRLPLGKMIKREMKSSRYSTQMPSAPDGEYFIIQYATVFDKKKESVETITVMKDIDHHWRVSGYYIK